MNLLFLSSIFPDAAHPFRGTYNGEFCCALATNHQVRVIAPRAWPEVIRGWRHLERFVAPPACALAGVDCRYPVFLYPPGILHRLHGRMMWSSIRDEVIRMNSQDPIDGVLSYWAHPDGEAGLCAARLASVPHVVIVGGSDVLLLPQDPGRRRNVVNVLQNSQAVVTVSEGLRDAVMELGVPPERVHTIYQGVDPEIFHPRRRFEARTRLGLCGESPRLLWVGRMVDVKGLHILIEACAELQLRGVDFELSLVGDGSLRAEMEGLVAGKGLNRQIRFVGPVGHDQLPDWYSASDVTLLSSWSEGLPNVVRESLACGTPFVSTDVGSIREIADSEFCVLVDPGDPGGLADAVVQILDGDHHRAAARYVPRTWNDCARDVAQLFSDLRGIPLRDDEFRPPAGCPETRFANEPPSAEEPATVT